MTRDTKILIALLAAVLGFALYSHNELSDRLRTTEANASVCHCPTSNAGQLALASIQSATISQAASHTYFELLLEGLARDAGLPLDRARAAFDKETKDRRPAGWRWLPAWEGPTPSTDPTAP